MTKIPDEVFSEAVAILGKSGSGKSYCARGMVETLLARGERVCILDPTSVWHGLRSSADGKRPGVPVAVFGGLNGDIEIGEHSGPPLARLIADRNLPSIIDISELGMGARTRFATGFLEELYRANRRPLTLVVDEADLFAPQRPMPDQTVLLNRMEQIVRRGRVRGFRPWLITQRPAELHKSVLSQAATLIAMKLPAPQDRDAIGAWIDGQADRAEGKALLAALPKLGLGEGFLWCPAIGFLERMKFPPITTFDSGRTPEHGEQIEAPAALADVDLAGVLEALKPVEPAPAKVKRGAAVESDPKALEEEYQRGYSDGEVAGYDKGQDETLARCRAAYQAAEPGIFEAVVDGQFDEVKAAPASPVIRFDYVPPSGETRATVAQRGAAIAQARAADVLPDAKPRKVTEGLSGPQQKLLDTLARLASLGVTQPDKVTLAVMADVSERSSTYANNLGALRTAGLIDYPAKGHVTLTAEGRKAANHAPRATTNAELHEAWLRAVSGPQAAILGALIRVFPRAMTREDVAEKTGASPTSSTFANNLGRLRTMGAIDYPTRGAVVATPLLFPRDR